VIKQLGKPLHVGADVDYGRLAEVNGCDASNIRQVLDVLGEAGLYAEETGSIPRYRARIKEQLLSEALLSPLTSMSPITPPPSSTSDQNSIPPMIRKTPSVTAPQEKYAEAETETEAETEAETEVRIKTEAEAGKGDSAVALRLTALGDRQKKFEEEVRGDLKTVKSLLEDVSRAVPVVSPLRGGEKEAEAKPEAKPEEVPREEAAEGDEGGDELDLDNTVVTLRDLVTKRPDPIMAYINTVKQRAGIAPEGEIPASEVSFRKILLTLPIPMFMLYDQEKYLGTIPSSWTFGDYVAFLDKDRMKLIYGLQQQQAAAQQSNMLQQAGFWG